MDCIKLNACDNAVSPLYLGEFAVVILHSVSFINNEIDPIDTAQWRSVTYHILVGSQKNIEFLLTQCNLENHASEFGSVYKRGGMTSEREAKGW